MKLKNFGRAALALAASAVMVLGMTSCTLGFTVGYLFVTGSATGAGINNGEIATYKIKNNDGSLSLTNKVGSGGPNPTQVVVNASGSYLYVLNDGLGTDASPAVGQIDLFAIGGSGVVTHQATFNPKGSNTRNIVIAGNFLYALDEFAPGGTGPNGTQSFGDITAFAIDSTTGRLTPILNNQARDSNGLPLTYFPVGTNPTWLAVNGSFAYIAEQGLASGTNPNDPPQAIFIYNQSATSGQLTLTQSTPTPTGATQLTYVYSTSTFLYALDAGPAGSTGFILPYTVGSGGTLAAVPSGARANNAQSQAPVGPSRVLKETTHNFLWVANSGINTNLGAGGNVITAYTIQANGQLFDANTGGANGETAGTGTRAIVEDPSNQYVYTVNFNDSTITGKKVNQQTGGLDALVKAMPAPPTSPTWCATTGSTF
ncbi:MAG TPA: beta-propeller fold lactonase family protein [Acidobacteriaceae bacterium]|jgi:6-phosphogluconolactonase (cycloisomerase 2 family)|nr:beta-propeller fold lactonase family protein [Acidobacteriaceae bacterium]